MLQRRTQNILFEKNVKLSRNSCIKLRNSVSNYFNFSSSIFLILQEIKDLIKIDLYNYTEELIDEKCFKYENVEDATEICNYIMDVLNDKNYTVCGGITEDSIVKLDLQHFELSHTYCEKFGSCIVLRSRQCVRVVLDRSKEREGEVQALCQECQGWLETVLDLDSLDLKQEQRLVESEEQPSSEDIFQLKQHFCPVEGCDKSFKTNMGKIMRKHIATTHSGHSGQLPTLTEQAIPQVPPLNMKQPTYPSHPKRTVHPCQHPGCGYIARSVTVLRYHMPKHTGEMLFCCTTCGKNFKHKKELNLCEKKHLGIFDYLCEHCDKKFVTKKKFDLHVRVHTGDKPFICPVCRYRWDKQ